MFAFANENDIQTGMMGSYSTDGGKTWTARVVGNGSDGIPSAFSDPWTAWDTFGNLFISYISNPNNTQSEIAVSTDGGKTFKGISEIPCFDHPEIAVGAGMIWQTVAVNTTNGIDILCLGAAVTGLGQIGTFKQFTVPGSDSENFGDIAITPSGAVVVAFQSSLVSTGAGPDKILVSTDPTGLTGTFSNPVTAANINVGNSRSIPAQSTRKINAVITMDADQSPGANKGRVYISYTDAANTTTNDTNVFVIHSDDSGKTWSAPVRVNDDKTTNSQFFSHVAVDQTSGNVGVAWYDCRNDPNNTEVETFAAISQDGGQTFSANVQVATGPSDAATADGNHNNGNDFGDYLGLGYNSGELVPAWCDNNKLVQGNPDLPNFDIVISVIQTPGFVPPPTPPGGGGGGLGDDRFDPNETSDKGTQLGVLTGGQELDNLVINHHPGNGLPAYDWFELTAGQSGRFAVKIIYTPVADTADGNIIGDLNMRLFTLSGNTLIQIGVSKNKGVTTQAIAAAVTAGEPLLVWIYGFKHADATYTLQDSIA
jgi:hypothetical protein